ncbi:MAG: MptD family putative ECF transporter S component [Spirochaetaceae bacterium]|jgi:energy-coupling factor transport system substrate-specific component|nr:MptD family putative ECF transporter S component [Spirochaetaceae bacterium]
MDKQNITPARKTSPTKKGNRLGSKDVISIGIFTAVYLVIYTILGVTIGMVPVIGVFLFSIMSNLFSGSVFMLMAVKARKTGVFLIAGLAMAFFTLTSNNMFGVLGCAIAAMIAEVIASRRNYQKAGALVMAYAVYETLRYGSFLLPMFLNSEVYFAAAAERWGVEGGACTMCLRSNQYNA